MKILYLISTLEDKGPVSVLYNLIQHLDRDKFEPTIITISPERKNSRIDDFKKLDVTVISLGCKKIDVFTKGKKELKKIINQLKPELIHAQCFRSTLLAGLFFSRHNVLTTLHNYPPDDYTMKFGPILGRMMDFANKLVLKRFSTIFSVSHHMQKRLKKHYKLEIAGINNGIDYDNLNQFDAKTVKSKIRDQYDISYDASVYLYMDNVIAIKDPETTIKGFLKAFSDSVDKILIFCGGGKLLEELKDKYSKEDNIKFIGHVNEPFEYFLAADYYITSSLSESFHLSVVEALAAGLSVVLSDIEAHRYILEQIPHGKTYKCGNYEDLAEVLKEVSVASSNFTVSEELLSNCKFTAKAMSMEYQKNYKRVIDGKI